MTSKDKVLAVYPNAFAVRSNGWLWSVYPDNASGCLNSAEDSSETEEAAWQNAAESLPAAPEQETDEKDDAWKSMVESILPEPVAPVEAQEKYAEGFYCVGNEAGVRDICTIQCRGCADTQRDKGKANNHVAEPKPTPSTDACKEVCVCGGCPHFNPYDPWNRRGQPKPQPDSSSIPDIELELRRMMWLGHGHTGMYGDDGEMQCSECRPFGVVDYKREPLDKVRETFRAVQTERMMKPRDSSSIPSERMQGVDCPECEDGSPHSHYGRSSSIGRAVEIGSVMSATDAGSNPAPTTTKVDSSSISTEQTFDGWWAKYALTDEAHQDSQRDARMAWNAAKGQGNGR